MQIDNVQSVGGLQDSISGIHFRYITALNTYVVFETILT